MERLTGLGGWLRKTFSTNRSDKADGNRIVKNTATKSDGKESSQNNLNQGIEQDGNRNLIQNLEEKVQTTSEKELNFDKNPTFIKTIRTKAAKKESKAIFGLAVLDEQLFIISEHSSDVEVYDSQSLTFKYQFHLEGLYDPVDIKSSSRNDCIYIFDWKGKSNEIMRVGLGGKLITQWITGDDGGYISVTPEATVLLSVWEKSLLKEFSADGKFLGEIQLVSHLRELRLAVKLANGHYVVSHGEGKMSQHRVCLANDKGVVLKSIGGRQGSSNGEFYSPNYMVVDGTGFILVADQNNRRVVLLRTDLEFRKEVIEERDGLRYPVRMDLDRTSGRLFVADNDYLEDHTGWRDGRLMAFEFKKIRRSS